VKFPTAALTPTQALVAVAASDLPCLLCGSPDAPNVAAFMPTSNEALALAGPMPSGKQRLLFYRACDRCVERAQRDPKGHDRRILQVLSGIRPRRAVGEGWQ
jgi:hypothetical protein